MAPYTSAGMELRSGTVESVATPSQNRSDTGRVGLTSIPVALAQRGFNDVPEIAFV